MRSALLTTFLLPFAAAAMGTPPPGDPNQGRPIINLRVDNDLFAGQDQGYTSGVQLTAVSPNLADYTTDPGLPPLARWFNRHLAFLDSGDADERNMVLRIAQGIYTPGDPARTDLMVEDRPYAGTLMAVFGYNTRNGDAMTTTLLGVGVLGPASMAEQSQDAIHGLSGSDRFQGWDHQLENELLLGIRREHSRRLGAHAVGAGGLQRDTLAHWGWAFGNPMTRVNAGFELRLGRDLPDDFGSSPMRPSGDNTAPLIDRGGRGWAWHVFLAVDGYWSLYEPSLDGNLFRDSHSVDKRPFVGEAAVGFSMTRGRWKLAFARYFRTLEFEGQRERPEFGSVTLSRHF